MKLSPFKTILIFLVLVIAGFALVSHLPIKLQSSTILPSITVSYSWNSATGRVMEREVTARLEGIFSKVRGVKNISSMSSTGHGSICIDFDNKTDFDAVRFEISTLIRQAYTKFPEGVSYPSLYMNRPDNEAAKPLLSYTINAPASLMHIQQYAKSHIEPVLSTIKGIRNVDIYGANPMEWVLEYDANLLESLDVSTSDIQRAIYQYLAQSDAGIGMEQPKKNKTSMINLVLKNYDPKNINFLNLPVKKIGNRMVYLKDLVTIRHQERKSDYYYRINGANSITVVVYVNELENQLKVSDRIQEEMKNVASQLPKGYFLLKTYDGTDVIRQELSKSAYRAFVTLILILLFVFIVNRQFRYLLLLILSLIADLGIAALFYSILKMEISLYSVAGIAISLGLMLENNILMIEHYRRYKNRRIFMAILAATLTTVAALMSVFFLENRLGINLVDFGRVLSVNLIASLVVALFLIPAMMEKIPLRNYLKKDKRYRLKYNGIPRQKIFSKWMMFRYYQKLVQFLLRFKKTFIALMILGFGIPLFLLPPEMQPESPVGRLYNSTLGNRWYSEHLKTVVEKLTGGALRLFVEDVYEKSNYKDLQQTVLYVDVQLPEGSTVDQMNELVIPLEHYLLKFQEIDQFKTSINGGQNAQISIFFKKEFQNNDFPIQLKEQVIRRSIDLGGADWNVHGVGECFDNSVQESLGNSRIRLYGFNYDELFHWAEVVKKYLLVSPRIREVNILSQDQWSKDRSYEFVMDLDREKLINQNGSPDGFYGSLKGYDLNDCLIASIVFEGVVESVRMAPVQNKTMDIWQLQRMPNYSGKSMIRMQDVAKIKKEPASSDIAKENQQYCMILSYDYIGTNQMGQHIQDQIVKDVKDFLPLGYTVQGQYSNFDRGNESKMHYWLLCLVIVSIFFICSVLFESLRQPLVVIVMIPFSYIGLFLTFYLFDLNFDQGGFAAFIMLSGLSINPVLYMINEYDGLKRKYDGRRISSYRLYMKAFNRNIRSNLITVCAIILGLVPFLFGSVDGVFWPALAGGTIGGLLFSIIGFVLLLPVALLKKEEQTTNKKSPEKRINQKFIINNQK